MPRPCLVVSLRLAHSWSSKGWTPLVPSRRFGLVRRFDFARRGFIRRWLTVLLWAFASAGVACLGIANAAEPAAPVTATSGPAAAEPAAPATAAPVTATPGPAAAVTAVSVPAASIAAPSGESPSVVPAPAPATVKLDHLSVEPAAVALGAADERVQLVVTAYSSDGSMTDMTHKVEYCPADAKIARVDDGMVIPAGDGGVDIEVRATDPADGHQLTVRVPVKVQGYDVVRAVDFANDVEPTVEQIWLQQRRLPRQGLRPERVQAVADGSRHGARLRRAGQAGARTARLSGRSRPFAAVDQADRAVCPWWRQAVRRRFAGLSVAAALDRARDAAWASPTARRSCGSMPCRPSGSCTVRPTSSCGSWPHSPTARRRT